MDGRTHRQVGVVAGGGVALLRADGRELWERILEGIGGAVGGGVGAKVPDWLEPAVHSWHRSFCHSVGLGAASLHVVRQVIGDWEAQCRANADRHAAALQDASLEPLARLGHVIAEAIWRMLAGFFVGFIAGYLSHLALDAKTPRGIPLLMRGC